MVILLQLEAMIDFLEARPDLALGHLARTKEGRCLSRKLWCECSETLNCVSANCPKKTPEQWRSFYNEYKFKIMKKVKTLEEVSTSGRQVSWKAMLTPLQERLYNILKGANGDSFNELHTSLIFEHQVNDDSNHTDIDTYDAFMPKSKSDRGQQLRSNNKILTKPSRKRLKTKYSPKSTNNDITNLTSDEFHFFGLNVASQLRQLPLHVALKMQVKIQNDLCKARLDATDAVEANPLDRRGFGVSMLKEESEEES